MSTIIILIISSLMVGAIAYLLEEIRHTNEEAEWQYIQCKLSNIQTNLSLVEYLLKRISK